MGRTDQALWRRPVVLVPDDRPAQSENNQVEPTFDFFSSFNNGGVARLSSVKREIMKS